VVHVVPLTSTRRGFRSEIDIEPDEVNGLDSPSGASASTYERCRPVASATRSAMSGPQPSCRSARPLLTCLTCEDPPIGVSRAGLRFCDDSRRDALVSKWYHPIMALTLRTDDELEAALAALAEAEGLSRQEVIRRAVLERYERAGHRARVQVSTDRMLDRWGDVLDRLGSV
jgi:hypothetical protein